MERNGAFLDNKKKLKPNKYSNFGHLQILRIEKLLSSQTQHVLIPQAPKGKLLYLLLVKISRIVLFNLQNQSHLRLPGVGVLLTLYLTSGLLTFYLTSGLCLCICLSQLFVIRF